MAHTLDIESSGKEDVTTQHLETASDSGEKLEVIRTISKFPGNPNYYEKGGLRTEGDGLDHTHFTPGKTSFIMTNLGCAMGLCASQIYPLLYLTLGTTIANDLNAADMLLWLLTAGLVAQGALASFVGPVADLIGRKMIFLVGFGLAIIGCILCAATPNAAGFLVGNIFLGFGAITQELMAIAIVAESIPTAKRPLFSALNLSLIIPWSPSTMYANWIAGASWRYIGLLLALWNVMSAIVVLVWYRPPPRVNSLGLTTKEKIQRIDFIGGAIITAALCFILVALNSGGISYPWTSGRVLAFLIIGFALFGVFAAWEFYGAKFPMYPRRIVHVSRPFFCMLFVIFAAGINYVVPCVFWPIQSIAVYQSNHFQTGVHNLPIGTCILGGAILSSLLLGMLPDNMSHVMLCFCIIQTIGIACLTVVDPANIHTVWAPLIFGLIGTGGALVPNQVIITVITPDDLIGSITALTVGLRAQSQVIGLAIFYNQYTAQVAMHTATKVAPILDAIGVTDPAMIGGVMQLLTAIPFRDFVTTIPDLAGTPVAEMLKAAVIETYAASFKYIYFITIAFGVSACAVASFLGNVGQYMDSHVAVPVM